MAVFLATFFGTVICFLIWFQIAYVAWYLRQSGQTQSPSGFPALDSPAVGSPAVEGSLAKGVKFPPVAVILCLRGVDPSLEECLTALQSQDYPCWELHLVVDCKSDPALEFVSRLLGPETSVQFHTIAPRTDSASLKCQAIGTVIPLLADKIEFLAFLDADTICDSRWLTDLIRPMISGEIVPAPVATTGNRWFIVTDNQLASHLRQIWNAAAVVQMSIYNIAWGGSFAIAKSAMQQADLPDRWSRAFCEDTMLSQVLGEHQMRLYRVPHLICPNRESTALSSVYHWIVRQLLTVRLYHPRWFLVQGHSLILLAVSLLAPLAALFCLCRGDWQAAGWITFAWSCFQGVNYRLLQMIEGRNLEILQQRKTGSQRSNGPFGKQTGAAAFSKPSESGFSSPAAAIAHPNDHLPTASPSTDNRLPQSRGWNFLLATLLAQLVHPLACLQASWTNKISWRGISYRIDPGKKIRLLEYRPYREIQSQPQPESPDLSRQSLD